ncbi:hypothetical protein NQ318_013589 [Aromia moschata]|uniref:Uncharacterized protein n=1 Tax=Aromia moschata TaxID=1265417 RepID=A0AAV8YEQ0_9CUCU|nr:hypothetical protein NQ318_013589 [Aromia moschata]
MTPLQDYRCRTVDDVLIMVVDRMESTLYIPPTAYLLQDTLKPTLNITWESSSNTLNNSLSFSLAQISKYYIINGAQLILVQDDELLVWRKNVVIMPETIDGMGTHSCHIKFEDDVEVFVSNMDFLYIGGEVEDNSIDTKPTESSEMTDKRVYHIEVATGSMALVVVVGITMYIIISKARQRALKSKNKANQHVAV